MRPVVELRMRNEVSGVQVQSRLGRMLDHDDYSLLLTGRCRVLKPNGQPLCVYLPGALAGPLLDDAYPALHKASRRQSDNRGNASGSVKVKRASGTGSAQTRSAQVRSSVAGAMEATGGRFPYCRMTAYNHHDVKGWDSIVPVLGHIARAFEQAVPERYAAQAAHGAASPEWLIPGTPFTTVTLNNTWPTAAHVDKGDLDQGFSCLAVLRRGDYSGGQLVLPRYGVAVDLHHGDLLLMDAHEVHGNVLIDPHDDEAERIAIVAYYRTNVAKCGSKDEEEERRRAVREGRNDRHLAATE